MCRMLCSLRYMTQKSKERLIHHLQVPLSKRIDRTRTSGHRFSEASSSHAAAQMPNPPIPICEDFRFASTMLISAGKSDLKL